MTYIFKLLMVGASLIILSCGQSQAEGPKGIKTVEFSAKGKPTKALKTPIGNQEVYDPTQDPEIRKLFREIYDHNRNPDNADVKYDYRRASSSFLTARTIQRNDLLRAGCVDLIIPVNGASTGPPKQYPVCKKANWGSPVFSSCEKANIDTNLLVQAKHCIAPCISDLKGNPVPASYTLDEIGPKSTPMPYDSFEEQLDGYFKAECRMYLKKN